MSTGLPDSAVMRLVADVGGTNARFAMVRGERGALQARLALPTGDYPDLASAVEEYLRRSGGERPIEAAVAIATPLAGDQIQMTNGRWSFSIEQTRQRLGMNRLVLLNDFAALARALPILPPAGMEQIGSGVRSLDGPMAVIGPGTGLGVASLIPVGERWIPIAGEGGHVTMCAASPREAELLAVLWRQFPHVSAERVLSGPGLVRLYQVIATLAGRRPEDFTPADVTRLALADTDRYCVDAVDTFCAMLGTVAGNLAVTLGASGGVFIGGGIVPRFGERFSRSPFRSRFEDKGRCAEYLSAIPTYVIRTQEAALLGSAMAMGVVPQVA
jgi:glucokinase